MQKLVKSAVAVLLFVLIASLAAGCGTQGAVGVVDVNKIMTDSTQVKGFQDQLNTKGKELSDQLAKDKANLSAEDFQKHQQDAYNQFLQVKQDYENQIDSTIKQAVQQVAQDKKLGVVLYKNSVAAGGTDITDDVLKKIQ